MASSSHNQPLPKEANLNGGGDMISRLPDEILIHILSLILTKDAFTTSILSTRWENLWTLVPNLFFSPKTKEYITMDDVRPESQDPRYLNFIDMILQLHCSNVEKFNLYFSEQIDESRLYAWVNALLKHNYVQEIGMCGGGMRCRFPRSLFTCKTLVSLKLYFHLQFDVPTSIYFPSLKVLHVSVENPSKDLTEKLFCSAPVLEELRLETYGNSGKSIYNISSPCLKKLVVRLSTIDVQNFDCVINIEAPVLETLDVGDSCFAQYILKNCASLTAAHIGVHAYNLHEEVLENKFLVKKLIMLLKSVSGVKNLHLAWRCPMAVFGCKFASNWPVFANVTRLELDVSDEYASESFARWPQFPNLRHLHLNVAKKFVSKNLSNLLALAPNLISLKIEKRLKHDNAGCFNSSEQVVPSCFRSSLREIEFIDFQGLSECKLNLIKYLLANTHVLEKMIVRFSKIRRRLFEEYGEIQEISSEIAKMPRLSKNCEIVFL